MNTQESITINKPKEIIWNTIKDIENSASFINGINKIEIIEKPEDTLTGFKWKETRTMYGKEATEIMWITEAEENKYYQTRAESHGSIYVSKQTIDGVSENTSKLTMEFDGTPLTLGSKIMMFLSGKILEKSLRKTIAVDLEDIKKNDYVVSSVYLILSLFVQLLSIRLNNSFLKCLLLNL
jgi:uncharacterized membrane protein